MTGEESLKMNLLRPPQINQHIITTLIMESMLKWDTPEEAEMNQLRAEDILNE